MEYYSAFKKNELRPFAATWLDRESIILSEGSQTEKEKHHMNLKFKNDTTEFNKTERDSENKPMVARGKG